MEKLINDFKISFTKGDTYALAIKFKNLSEDLRTAFFTVKENPDDEPLLQKSLGAGIDKIDDRTYKNEKTYKVQIQSEDTSNLEAHVQYLYDLQVTVGNVVKTIISGVFVVTHSLSGNASVIGSMLEIAVDDTLESEVSTTPATKGIEYEQDPVACAKIGDMGQLTTTEKGTIVGALNELKTGYNNAGTAIDEILGGGLRVGEADKAIEADHAVNADEATHAVNADEADHAKTADNSTLAEKAVEAVTVGNFILQGSSSTVVTKYVDNPSGLIYRKTITSANNSGLYRYYKGGTEASELGYEYWFADNTYGVEVLTVVELNGEYLLRGASNGAMFQANKQPLFLGDPFEVSLKRVYTVSNTNVTEATHADEAEHAKTADEAGYLKFGWNISKIYTISDGMVKENVDIKSDSLYAVIIIDGTNVSTGVIYTKQTGNGNIFPVGKYIVRRENTSGYIEIFDHDMQGSSFDGSISFVEFGSVAY